MATIQYNIEYRFAQQIQSHLQRMSSLNFPMYFAYYMPNGFQTQNSLPFMNQFLSPYPNFEGLNEEKNQPERPIAHPQGQQSLPPASLEKKNSRESTTPKQKKITAIKKKEKDEEFKQRQQTANRNLCSNTLKVYFKQVRDHKSETFSNLNKIITTHGLDISIESFLERLNEEFPVDKTYASFEKLRKMCSDTKLESGLEDYFGVALRISIRHFFLYEIHVVNIKSVRTTRKIRNQQVRQGRAFIKDLMI